MNRFLINTIFLGLFFIIPLIPLMVIGLIVFFRTPFVWYEYLLIGFLADVVSGPVEIGFFFIPLYSFIIIIIGLGAFFIRKRMTLHV